MTKVNVTAIATAYAAAYRAWNKRDAHIEQRQPGWLHVDGPRYSYSTIVKMTETLRERVMLSEIRALPGAGPLANYLAQQFAARPHAEVIEQLRRVIEIIDRAD